MTAPTKAERDEIRRLAESYADHCRYVNPTLLGDMIEKIPHLLTALDEAEARADHMNEQAAAFAKRASAMDEENKRLRSAAFIETINPFPGIDRVVTMAQDAESARQYVGRHDAVLGELGSEPTWVMLKKAEAEIARLRRVDEAARALLDARMSCDDIVLVTIRKPWTGERYRAAWSALEDAIQDLPT